MPAEIIKVFEAGELVGMMDLQVTLRDVLESVGIGFPFTIESGQFLPAPVPYSSPERPN